MNRLVQRATLALMTVMLIAGVIHASSLFQYGVNVTVLPNEIAPVGATNFHLALRPGRSTTFPVSLENVSDAPVTFVFRIGSAVSGISPTLTGGIYTYTLAPGEGATYVWNVAVAGDVEPGGYAFNLVVALVE